MSSPTWPEDDTPDADRRTEAHRRAKPLEGLAENALERLQQLYEIGKHLARFESVAQTVPMVLALVSQTVAVRIATLMLEPTERPSRRKRSIVWHADGVSGAQLRAGMEHAKKAYCYLVDGSPSGWPEEPPTSPKRLPSVRPVPDEHRSFVLLPLVVERQRIFGAVQIEGVARLDEADLRFLNAVVNQLAVALDRVAIIERTEATAIAGRLSAEFLSDTSVALFSSLDYAATIDAVSGAVIPRLADTCLIDVVADDGQIWRVLALVDAEKPRRTGDRAVAPVNDSWHTQVMLEGGSFLIERLEGNGVGQPDGELLAKLGARSMMAVPLAARGRVFGVLTFIATQVERSYSRADLAMAEEVGRRAAIAIDNAKLYERERHAVEARQDLLAVVSHDLRNPLNVIRLSAQGLLDLLPPDRVEWRKPTGTIARTAQRMGRIIADLLDLASIEAGRLTVEMALHAVEPLVREALDLQQPLAQEKGLSLDGPSGGEMGEVRCDRDRMLQVFGNLIGNAIKFSPRGSVVTVHAERLFDELRFSVADTGPGIAPQDLPHVFDRYWQARATARLGSGLGLSVAQGLVEAHGGRIWGESTVGRGTTFFFTIPGAPPSPIREHGAPGVE